MSQVNSGFGTKSCTYDFRQNGGLGSGVYSFSGISLKPGEALVDVKVTKFDNFVSAGGNTVTFSLGFGPNPSPAGYYTTVWRDQLGSLNTYLWLLWKGQGITTSFDDASYKRIPATLSSGLNFWFTSSAALTAGKCTFVLTYAYAKFT